MTESASEKSECGFFFVRHGQSISNRNEVSAGGDIDPGLTDAGREQARVIAGIFEYLERKPGYIVTPPLKRTLETARIINRNLHLEIRIETSLIERFLGDWNGQSSAITDPLLKKGITPPNGESATDFRNRILDSFRNLSQCYENWPLIVGSRGPSRVLLEELRPGNGDFLANGELMRVHLCPGTEFRIAAVDRL